MTNRQEFEILKKQFLEVIKIDRLFFRLVRRSRVFNPWKVLDLHLAYCERKIRMRMRWKRMKTVLSNRVRSWTMAKAFGRGRPKNK